MKHVFFLTVAALFTFFIIGCTDSEKAAKETTEKIIEQATGEDVEIKTDKDGDKASVTIKDKDGEEVTFSGGDNEMPSDFPSDLYIPEGEIESSGSIASPDGQLITVNLYSTKTVADLKKEITEKLQSTDWTQSSVMDVEGSAMYNYAKGADNVTITLNQEGEKTSVSYMVGISKEK